MRDFKRLLVWQSAVDISVDCYNATESFRATEAYGLTSQMRRSSVSIASNIAEGCGRDSPKDFARFLRIAYASGCELETQAQIALRVRLGDADALEDLVTNTEELRRMLYAFVTKMPDA